VATNELRNSRPQSSGDGRGRRARHSGAALRLYDPRCPDRSSRRVRAVLVHGRAGRKGGDPATRRTATTPPVAPRVGRSSVAARVVEASPSRRADGSHSAHPATVGELLADGTTARRRPPARGLGVSPVEPPLSTRRRLVACSTPHRTSYHWHRGLARSPTRAYRPHGARLRPDRSPVPRPNGSRGRSLAEGTFTEPLRVECSRSMCG